MIPVSVPHPSLIPSTLAERMRRATTAETADRSHLEALRAEVAGLRQELTRTRSKGGRLMLSFREAARRLGVDRCTALPELVRRGALRSVDSNGRKMIPAVDVERLAQDGFDVTGPAPKKRTSRPRAKERNPRRTTADAIRALKF